MRDGSASATEAARMVSSKATDSEISGLPWGRWTRGSRSVASRRGPAACSWRRQKLLRRPELRAHAAELGNELPKEPLIFLKPPSAIIGPQEAIVLTKYSNRVEHEGELAIVIGRRCSNLLEATMPSLCDGDIRVSTTSRRATAEERRSVHSSKGFDTFCPVGPHIETDLDPSSVLVETRVKWITPAVQ